MAANPGNRHFVGHGWPRFFQRCSCIHATDRWRYIKYANGAEELYDEANGPNEWTNVVANPQNQKITRELAQWLPKVNLPPAPNSAKRILVQENGFWLWEGKPIRPEELVQ